MNIIQQIFPLPRLEWRSFVGFLVEDWPLLTNFSITDNRPVSYHLLFPLFIILFSFIVSTESWQLSSLVYLSSCSFLRFLLGGSSRLSPARWQIRCWLNMFLFLSMQHVSHQEEKNKWGKKEWKTSFLYTLMVFSLNLRLMTQVLHLYWLARIDCFYSYCMP